MEAPWVSRWREAGSVPPTLVLRLSRIPYPVTRTSIIIERSFSPEVRRVGSFTRSPCTGYAVVRGPEVCVDCPSVR